eukprot:TRINITY_DN23242_c0_g1_i1.p1 TRINITY_DN23242_c0_g1~~TRINITY_DN23242_c0_g1_i1.p1  ORF type:complete len:431 (+),score=19.35 TRINITY_DN23242_c0_g1_i1:2-1294(+)
MAKLVVVWVVIIAILLQISLQQQNQLDDVSLDECLNGSVSINITETAIINLNPTNSSGFNLPEPTTKADIINFMRILYQTLSVISSPYALTIGIGFPSGSLFGIQQCAIYSEACSNVNGDPFYAFMVSPSFNQDSLLRFYRVGDRTGSYYFDPTVIASGGDFSYVPSTRPWWAANNTWSVPYEFTVGRIQSRTYVLQPYTNGVRIFSDRIPNEPCSPCLSRSPCVALANYMSSNAPVESWSNVTNLTGIQNILRIMLLNYLVPWQLQETINSLGLGFANNDFYLITDCFASPINASIPECQTGRYFAEVRNTAYFGDDSLHAFPVINSKGDLGSARNENRTFPTTQRPWYQRGLGWTDPFRTANTATGRTFVSRSYSRWVYGGVVAANLNTDRICPTPSKVQEVTTSSASSRSSFLFHTLSRAMFLLSVY